MISSVSGVTRYCLVRFSSGVRLGAEVVVVNDDGYATMVMTRLFKFSVRKRARLLYVQRLIW